MKRFFALALILAATGSTAGQPVFSSSTEDVTTGNGWFTPDQKIATAVLASADRDQRLQIREYLVTNKVKSARNLLAAAKIQLCSTCKETYLFLRPTSERYSPWYGAHSFTYWLITPRGKVVHTAAVDSFDLLEENNAEFRPIEQSICVTSKCYVTRLERVGDGYSTVSCRTRDIAYDKTENSCEQQ